uniref:Uncharacterized protein n=1 Tax=Picea sitchensis TaxID=3332 RepID=A9NKF4_PICSI|nr:unknown [Picea sitchensis]
MNHTIKLVFRLETKLCFKKHEHLMSYGITFNLAGKSLSVFSLIEFLEVILLLFKFV